MRTTLDIADDVL
jgi:hypothetical protein